MFWKSSTKQRRCLSSLSRNRSRELYHETLDKRQPMAVDVTSFAWGQGGDEPQAALVSVEDSGNDQISSSGTFESATSPILFGGIETELYHDNVDVVFFAEVAEGDDPLLSSQFFKGPGTEGSTDPEDDALSPSSSSGFRPVFVVLQQGDDIKFKDVAEPVAKVVLEKIIERFRPKVRIPFRRDSDGQDQNPLNNRQEESAKRTQPEWRFFPRVGGGFSPVSNDPKDWNSREDFMKQLKAGQIDLTIDFEWKFLK